MDTCADTKDGEGGIIGNLGQEKNTKSLGPLCLRSIKALSVGSA